MSLIFIPTEYLCKAVEKAKAFLLLSTACDQADESKRAVLLESAVKALNNVSRPDPRAKDKEAHHEYVRSLDNTGYQLSGSFRELTEKDEHAALALTDIIQKPDLRTFATVGVLLGVNDLLAGAK